MVTLEDFLTDRGRIRFRKVARVGFGTVIGAAFTGVVSVILGLAEVPLALVRGAGDFLTRGIGLVLAFAELAVRGSFADAAATATDGGPIAFALGVGLVLVTLYAGVWVVSRA